MIFMMLVGWVSLAAPGDRIDFDGQVAPIFERHCVRCHQPGRLRGELDLTRPSSVVAGRGDGHVVVAGRPDESVLLDMVSGDPPEMPRDGEPLTRDQVGVLRRWIAEGAAWPESRTLVDRQPAWWSLAPLRRPPIPRHDTAWARNAVDAFVLAALSDRQLSPSPEADERTLIRRLYYDLIGLPPPPEEVERFLRDAAPDAYERLVDRLLDSPHYGERWGRHWLDVVHYGDTHGYDKDKLRPHAWPYRDYVIRAFNTDKPYERFVSEQLAGDILFGDAAEATTALGFIVAGPFDWVGQIEVREGTVEKKRVRNLDRDDMVASTMNTFVSLTAQCARCHDHKFDPISQEDYYSLQAVFAGVDRAERPVDLDPLVARRRRELGSRHEQLVETRARLVDRVHDQAGPRLAELEKRISAARSASSAERPEFGYHSQIEASPDVVKWVQVDLGTPQTIERLVLVGCHDTFNDIGAGFGFPVRFRIDISSEPDFRAPECVLDGTDRDVENPGVAPQTAAVGGRTARFVRVTATRLAPRRNDFIFALAELQVLDPSGRNLAAGSRVTSLDSIEAPVRWRRTNLVDGIYYGVDAAAGIAPLEAERERLLAERVAPETAAQLAEVDRRIARIDAALGELPAPQPVFSAATSFAASGNFTPTGGQPREILLLHRGDVNQPGPAVLPGTVGAVAGLESRFPVPDAEGEGPRRAALARWIVNRRNPLTWRSIANRVWGYHFGRGLVETPNDFGRMGAPPTHPDLLDWLAVEFRDGGQSIKELHRLIVTSATYRQSSAFRAGPARADGGNHFLWRMNRRRLDAESIRDSALVIAGRLDDRLGGPGFKPFGFKDDHSPHYHYETFDPDDPSAQRRSVYRFIVRSVPDPLMTTLDCADPSLNVARRNETITPLQALAMLNNPFMVRAAEHFAARLEVAETQRNAQIELAVRLAFGRSAEPGERAAMSALADEHGLVYVCRLIMNANEFVFVD